MSSLNKVILIGHLGADPEMRSMPDGNPVCNFRVATTEVWKDKATGEKRETTEWHRIVLYRRLAEIAAQYLRKGSQVYLEGRIRTRKWQDKEGLDRYTTEIEASEMTMLGVKSSPSPLAEPEMASANAQTGSRQDFKPANRQPPVASSGSDFPDDDIPF